MNEGEQQAVQQLQQAYEAEQLKRMNMENQYNSIVNSPDENKNRSNIVEYQLDLNKELDRMFHLLSGHILKIKDDGSEKWDEPDDDRLKILSDYGIKQIISLLHWYLHKGITLSNFTDEMIIWKTKDFGTKLTRLVFNRYEKFFYYPTVEDLYEKYKKIAEDNNIKYDDKELYEKCYQWSKEELQSKYRHFDMLINIILDNVHATLLRALHGEEKKSINRNVNIHQTLNDGNNLFGGQPKFNLVKPNTWK